MPLRGVASALAVWDSEAEWEASDGATGKLGRFSIARVWMPHIVTR